MDHYLVVGALILLGCVVWLNPRTYASNDNFGIIDNALAGYATPYAGYATTASLHFLYGAWPTIPWLGVILYGTQFLAAGLMLCLVSIMYNQGIRRVVAALLVGCFFLPFMLRPDYNASSILLGGCAVMYLVFGGEPRNCWRNSGLIVALCFLSYSLRRMGFFASLCFAAPFASFGVWQASGLKRGQIAFVATVVASLILADRLIYNWTMPLDYRQYSAFNDVRKLVHETPYMQSGLIDPKVLTATGWTPNDHWLFAQWFYFDEGKFNIRSVTALSEVVRSNSFVPRSLYRNLIVLWGNYWKHFLVFALLVTLVVLSGRRRNAVSGLGALFAFTIGILFLQTYWYFPDRIALPLFAIASLGIVCIASTQANAPGTLRLLAVSLIVATISSASVMETFEVRRENTDRNWAFKRAIDRLNDLPADSTVLFEGGVLRMDWSDPLGSFQLKPNQVRTGMSIFSPVFYRALNNIGLRRASELIPFLARSGRGYALVYEDSLPHISQFAHDVYGIDLKFTALDFFETGGRLYKLSVDPEQHQ